MRFATLTPLALALTAGCVLYDHTGPMPLDDCADGSDGSDGSFGTPAPDPVYTLDPSVANPGTSFIASLQSDQAVDYATIVDLNFVGAPIGACTSQARDDELLVTLVVDAAAEPGPADLILWFDDGSEALVPKALTIEPASSSSSSGDGSGSGEPDGSGSTDGSTDGGSSDSLGDSSLCG